MTKFVCYNIQTYNRISTFNFDETRKVNEVIQRQYMDMCESVQSTRKKKDTCENNGFKTFLQMSYHHEPPTHTCMHTTTNTHMHVHMNTQGVKGVHTSTVLLYTHTCLASAGVTCFCLPLQCYIIMYYHMHACLYVCCQ